MPWAHGGKLIETDKFGYMNQMYHNLPNMSSFCIIVNSIEEYLTDRTLSDRYKIKGV